MNPPAEFSSERLFPLDCLAIGSSVWLADDEDEFAEIVADVVAAPDGRGHAARIRGDFGATLLPRLGEVVAVSVAWQNDHDDKCEVSANRDRLADDLQADPQNLYHHGAVPEHDAAGDDEGEFCTCGQADIARDFAHIAAA